MASSLAYRNGPLKPGAMRDRTLFADVKASKSVGFGAFAMGGKG